MNLISVKLRFNLILITHKIYLNCIYFFFFFENEDGFLLQPKPTQLFLLIFSVDKLLWVEMLLCMVCAKKHPNHLALGGY